MTVLRAAVEERGAALRNLRYWWQQCGPLGYPLGDEQEELVLAIKRFMDADEELRAAQSALAVAAENDAAATQRS